MALDFPNTPTNGQSYVVAGVTWTWDGTKWVVGASAGPFLPLAGGTMTGPMTLAGNATAPLNPVSLQQLTAATTGAFLPLTGGTVAGDTTINGNVFPANGNLRAPGRSAMPADAIGAWMQPFEMALGYNSGHIAFNGYIGTGPAWKALTTGYGAMIYLASAGNLNVALTPSAPAGTAFGAQQSFNFNQDGSFTSPGAITSGGWITSGTGISSSSDLYVTGRMSINPTNSWEWAFYRDGSNDQIQAHRSGYYQRWTNSGGNWIWVGGNVQAMSLSPGGSLSAAGSIASAGIVSSSGADGNGYGASFSGGVWTHGQIWADSNITTPNTVTGGYVRSTGEVRADGSFMSGSGTFYVAFNYNYYLARNSGDGAWRFVENGTVNCTIDTGGGMNMRWGYTGQNFHSTGNSWADGSDYAVYGQWVGGNGDNTFGIYRSSGLAILQFAGNWYIGWNTSNGDLRWFSGSNEIFHTRTSDWLFWNPTGPVGGIGGYNNYSDRRGKENIEPTEVGLPEILKLSPVRFTRIAPPGSTNRKYPDGRPQPDFIPRSEIGFVAQDVLPWLPEAVMKLGKVLPDGTGGLEDENPTLGMTLDPIVAALVNAVKTLNETVAALTAKVAALEGRAA